MTQQTDYSAVLDLSRYGLSLCLGVRLTQGRLSALDLLTDLQAEWIPNDMLIQQLQGQLARYFINGDDDFDLPRVSQGSEFQQRVWQAMEKIPYGETRSYGELAKEIGSHPRAVGGACRVNPLPLIVPCHRVVAARGVGGYAGAVSGSLLAVKQWLLKHEFENA